jgi:cytochrome bd-type quinol oxidase subunit 2
MNPQSVSKLVIFLSAIALPLTNIIFGSVYINHDPCVLPRFIGPSLLLIINGVIFSVLIGIGFLLSFQTSGATRRKALKDIYVVINIFIVAFIILSAIVLIKMPVSCEKNNSNMIVLLVINLVIAVIHTTMFVCVTLFFRATSVRVATPSHLNPQRPLANPNPVNPPNPDDAVKAIELNVISTIQNSP